MATSAPTSNTRFILTRFSRLISYSAMAGGGCQQHAGGPPLVARRRCSVVGWRVSLLPASSPWLGAAAGLATAGASRKVRRWAQFGPQRPPGWAQERGWPGKGRALTAAGERLECRTCETRYGFWAGRQRGAEMKFIPPRPAWRAGQQASPGDLRGAPAIHQRIPEDRVHSPHTA